MGRITVLATIAVAINTAIAIAVLRLSSSPALYVGSLAVVTTAVVVGLWRSEGRRLLFYSAAAVEFILGFLGIFSVGLPLIVASILLAAAAAADTPATQPQVGGQRS